MNQQVLRELLNQIDLDEQLRTRAVQQAISEASAWHWRARADVFLQAVPQPSDYIGEATQHELDEARTRNRATAQACLYRAAFIEYEAADD